MVKDIKNACINIVLASFKLTLKRYLFAPETDRKAGFNLFGISPVRYKNYTESCIIQE